MFGMHLLTANLAGEMAAGVLNRPVTSLRRRSIPSGL